MDQIYCYKNVRTKLTVTPKCIDQNGFFVLNKRYLTKNSKKEKKKKILFDYVYIYIYIYMIMIIVFRHGESLTIYRCIALTQDYQEL